jgi:EAL domain-containing protein (putative c-di-GMP-specific phosphodiesterase class I)
MNGPALDPPDDAGLQPLLEQLTREHFADFPLTEPQSGRVVAQFFQSRLTSTFQPVMRASDNSVAGHHGLLRVFDDSGGAVAPWNVFARASNDAQLVMLDRLTRTVHALNYFRDPSAGALFLNVEQRLLSAVPADHGTYFGTILGRLGIAPSRVVIVLPPSAIDDPVTFVRVAIAYRIRGYRVLAQLRSPSPADLAQVFLADPHYVALDVPAALASPAAQEERTAETRRLVEALTRRGINTIARRIETGAQAQAARDAGFGFLQGWHFAADGVRP